MKANLAKWSLILLCFFMAGAIGGGFYEHIVFMPLWSASPPASFSVIQPGTGVPLQTFWIPVHAGITIFVLLSLFSAWKDIKARRLLLVGLASYIIMRVWRSVFHSRDACVSRRACDFSCITRALGESRQLDLLELVQGASRHHFVPVFSACSVLAVQTGGARSGRPSALILC